MAGRLLRKPDMGQKPHHDIESFYWVVYYATIRWFTPDWTDDRVKNTLEVLFDEVFKPFDSLGMRGGANKLVELLIPDYIPELPEDTLLRPWLEQGRIPLALWLNAIPDDPNAAMREFAQTWELILKGNVAEPTTRIERVLKDEDSKPFAIHTASIMPSMTCGVARVPQLVSLPPSPPLVSDSPVLFNPSISAPYLGRRPTKRIRDAEEEMDYADYSDYDSEYVKRKAKKRRMTWLEARNQSLAKTKSGKGRASYWKRPRGRL